MYANFLLLVQKRLLSCDAIGVILHSLAKSPALRDAAISILFSTAKTTAKSAEGMASPEICNLKGELLLQIR